MTPRLRRSQGSQTPASSGLPQGLHPPAAGPNGLGRARFAAKTRMMPAGAAARREAIAVGGLRGRAIDAALKMVEARGAEAVNLRDLAGDLKTGPASLYYHFANKDALMAELAIEGFRRLRADFVAALANLRGRTPLHACGDAYLRFARLHPRLYRVMYAERLLTGHPVVREAEAAAFQTFAAGLSPDEPSSAALDDRAMALWAFGRGIAALTLSAADGDGPPPRELSRQIVRGLESLMGQALRGQASAD
jgi:AcrR family transcriptional regulator